MGPDRVARSLASLGTASSSRVFNLCAIALAQADNPAHGERPFFESRVLNSAILLKHRLRADETQLFGTDRAVATKIIIPFQKTDLRMGGQSFFVGQRSFEVLLRDVGNYRDEGAFERDMTALALLDRTPSLDPFMLREQLRSHGIQPDGCYFSISIADQQRIHAYAAKELRRLTSLAGGSRAGAQNASTSRMVTALLSNDVGEKLEPLRDTLGLSTEEFSEGVFSWRGFIYYKWTLQEFWPELIATLREVRSIQAVGQITGDQRAFFTLALNRKALARPPNPPPTR